MGVFVGSAGILGALGLFLLSGFVISTGKPDLADSTATYGFYLLIVGFLFQTLSALGDTKVSTLRVLKEIRARNFGLSIFIFGFISLLLTSLFMQDATSYCFYLLIIGVLIQLLLGRSKEGK